MDWSFVLNLLGTFFFAVSGCLLAARRGFDIVGSLLLGALTGLGGGIVRDLALGVPLAALADPANLIPPVAATLLVYFLMPSVERFFRTLLVFDAGGLALFCTTGTIAALGAGLITALWWLGWLNAPTQLLVAALVFAFRLLSLRYKWRVPHAARGGAGAQR